MSTRLLRAEARLGERNYYEASVRRPTAMLPLVGDVAADVLVVGGGFAGLSAALSLAERGYKVVLLEAQRIGSGASGRNGGQAILGYACGQATLQAQLGAKGARQAFAISQQAVDLIDQRIAHYGIDCDRVHGYLYTADRPGKVTALREEAELLLGLGVPCQWAEGPAVAGLIDSPVYQAAFYEPCSGHLHPLKYALGLLRAAQAAGVRVFEGSPVRRLERGKKLVAHTDGGRVSAAFGVLAGNCMLPEHGPQVAPELRARCMPVGTYIVATPALDEALCQRLIPSNAAVCDNNFVLDYFRFSADRRMLFGGRVSYTAQTPADLEGSMQVRMARVFPALEGQPIEYVWGGFVDISMNRAPDFGRLGTNLYYLQGFSGHGVALTGMAGQLVADSVAGQAEGFDLFARLQHRRFPGGAWLRTPTLAVGMWWHQLREALG